MTKFAVHTIVHRDGMPVAFAPGDELPGWAEGMVGDHCLTSEEAKPAKAVRADPKRDEAEPAGPDFTAPAPRRGRPRK